MKLSRDLLTTLGELAAGVMLTAGVYEWFGLGQALVAGSVALGVFSYLAADGGVE